MADVGPVSSFTARTPVILSTDKMYIDDGAGADWSYTLAVLMASLTKVNNVTVTKPATGSTLTIADGKTLTANNTLTLAGTDGKTLTVSNSLTLAGTDATTMTFPSTSATIARTDAAQTFTGVQTFNTPIATGSVATMTATVGGGVPTPPNNTTTFLRGDGTFAAPAATAPGGSNTQVQYNNSSAFGGISGVTTDGTNLTFAGSSLTFSGAQSASGLFSTSGIREKGVAATFTDTQASTTVATAYVNVWGAPTFNASNTITVTNAFNAYFKNPIAGTATLTNVYAIGADTINIIEPVGASALTLTGAIQTTSNPVINATQTWNAGGATFNGIKFAVTNTASGASSLLMNLLGGASGTTSLFSVRVDGLVTVANDIAMTNAGNVYLAARPNVAAYAMASIGLLAWSSSPTTAYSTFDTIIARLGPANVRQGSSPSATPTSQKFTLGEASRSGTDTNVGSASGTLQSGNGTGTGTASSLIFQTPVVVASGTGAQTQTTQLTLNSTGATFVPQVIHSLPENLKAYTVGTLPTGAQGDYAIVTDATAPTYNGTLTGGSSVVITVLKNATVWVSV